MKYHTQGINKNKKIREERNKPIPIGLMLNDITGIGIIGRREIEDKVDSKNIQLSKDDS